MRVKDSALHAVPQAGHVEIDEQAEAHSRQAQIGEELGVVDREDRIDAFQFDHQRILDHEVHAIGAAKADAAVLHREWHLPPERQACKGEFAAQARLVGAFQKARPECAMDPQGAGDDPAGQFRCIARDPI